jgi:hypothetical protein
VRPFRRLEHVRRRNCGDAKRSSRHVQAVVGSRVKSLNCIRTA